MPGMDTLAYAPIMQPSCAENFDREMACSEREWLASLPQAIGAHPFQQIAQALTAQIGAQGQLILSWRVAEPRTLGSASGSRLLVSFRFSGLDATQRYLFMRRFDQLMQRARG